MYYPKIANNGGLTREVVSYEGFSYIVKKQKTNNQTNKKQTVEGLRKGDAKRGVFTRDILHQDYHYIKRGYKSSYAWFLQSALVRWTEMRSLANWLKLLSLKPSSHSRFPSALSSSLFHGAATPPSPATPTPASLQVTSIPLLLLQHPHQHPPPPPTHTHTHTHTLTHKTVTTTTKPHGFNALHVYVPQDVSNQPTKPNKPPPPPPHPPKKQKKNNNNRYGNDNNNKTPTTASKRQTHLYVLGDSYSQPASQRKEQVCFRSLFPPWAFSRFIQTNYPPPPPAPFHASFKQITPPPPPSSLPRFNLTRVTWSVSRSPLHVCGIDDVVLFSLVSHPLLLPSP